MSGINERLNDFFMPRIGNYEGLRSFLWFMLALALPGLVFVVAILAVAFGMWLA